MRRQRNGTTTGSRGARLAVLCWAVVALGCAGGTGSGTGEDALADGAGPDGVVLNEISVDSVDGGPDWVELYNPSGAPVDVSGWALRDNDDAHEYVLPSGSVIPPGGYVVFSGAAAEGDVGFDFGFGSADEARLFDADGTLLDATAWLAGTVAEGTSWGRYPDGSGPFATLPTPTPGASNVAPATGDDVVAPPVDAGGPPADVPEPPADVAQPPEDAEVPPPDVLSPPVDAEPPPSDGVTPPEDAQPPTVLVVVNEVFARPAVDSTDEDWVELYNAGDAAVDIGGWVLKDADPLHAYTFPAGTILESGGYGVFSRDESGAALGFDFGLGPADEIHVFDAAGALVDETAWSDGQAPENQSWGRYPNGTGPFVTLLTPTPGAANESPSR